MEGQETRDRDSQTGKWTGRQGDWKTWTRDNNMDRKTGPKTEKQRQKYKEGQKQINRVNEKKDKWMEGKGLGERQVQ